MGFKPRALRVGFVPLTDCAPLIMAQATGAFARHGLVVKLQRELGWATIRDKIIYRELDAAHAVAGMPFAVSLGLGSIRCDCLTGLVLSLQGNAITLATALRRDGVEDAASLRQLIIRQRRSRTFTFGVAFPFSSHNFLLRQWLLSGGIQPDRDVQIVVVPPPQMFKNLQAGNLDGYCVGEPWNSIAVQSGLGFCVATSASLAPRHPEKVLLVRQDFAESRPEEHLALIAALLEACAYCAAPENAEHVIRTLAGRDYLNAPVKALAPSLRGSFATGAGGSVTSEPFHIFNGDEANEPSADKAVWILRQLALTGALIDRPATQSSLIQNAFRPDIFQQALQIAKSKSYEKPASAPDPSLAV